jgi:PAS domain S-box-containing protein
MPTNIKIDTLTIDILNHLNIIVTDANNNITFISDNYLNALEYTIDEVIGKNPIIFRHPTINNLPILNFVNKNGGHWNGLLKNITKSGKTIYFNADIYKDYDENGNHIGYHSIHTDITTTITNPHKFIFDNELLSIIFSENIEYLIICLSDEFDENKHEIIKISHPLLELIGIEADKLVEQHASFVDLISPKSIYYKNLKLLMHDLNNENPLPVDIKTKNRDAKYRVSYTPFKFNDKAAQLFTMIDITTEISFSDQLQSIIKSKNEFLANLAHEIKTPLNAINGFISLLQMRETNKEKLDYIELVLESVKHVINISNDTIDFIGMDNSKIEINPREFTPKDIQSTIEIFFAKSLEKNIELTAYISPQLPEIMFQDILRLKQIITNLISNALKFVNVDGRGTIVIECHFNNDKFYFTIVDNGIGMSTEQIENIFNPFYQASKDTKMVYGGTGLGLAVVNQIIELMGGSITVESELGVGSTFSVIIPVKSVKEFQHTIGRMDIPNIYIYAPSFSNTKHEILKKYLFDFTTAKINKVAEIDTLNSITDSVILLYVCDTDIKTILQLSKTNRIIVVKKMDMVINNFTNSSEIIEINLPILGSKIYDALNLLISGRMEQFYKNNFLDMTISGRILVADDQESNRLLINRLLSCYDVTIDVVCDGREAVNYFKKSIIENKSYYDLILLDVNMPILNGVDAAREIRLFEKMNNITRTTIISLTADRYTDKNDSRLVDMDEYIPKPINLKRMLYLIVKYTTDLKLVDENLLYDEKIKKLKEIRDEFLKPNNEFKTMIDNYKKHFDGSELPIIEGLKDLTNKNEFTANYNKIMKIFRKHG